MGFRNDLKLGKRGEQAVKNLLKNSGFSIREVDSEARKGYNDMIVEHTNRVSASLEVKLDRLAETTGNFCLEYYNPKAGKPSGINVTTADIYIYVIPDGSNLPIWAVSVKELKKFVRDNVPLKNLPCVGDGNAAVYLYRLDDILKIFTRLDILSPSLIVNVIEKLKGYND